MTRTRVTRGASTLWIVLLTVASTATTLVLACMTPFAALAALAAIHMRRRDGIVLMLLAWLASQLTGFLLLGYPHTASTFAWGIGIAAGAVAALLGAEAVLGRLARAALPVRLGGAFVAGLLAYKAVLLVCALFLGGVAVALDPAILLRQLVRDGAILVGLYALYRSLIALGVPAPQQSLAAA